MDAGGWRWPPHRRATRYAAALLAEKSTAATRFAYAMALAGDEFGVQQQSSAWNAEAAAHIRRPMTDAEYSPTDGERQQMARLEEASPHLLRGTDVPPHPVAR
jgi:uncharacterized protein (DUF2384 family)